MIKIDFHIHTINTEYDNDFSFSQKQLKYYTDSQKINAIAITNHNTFDINQYYEIKNDLIDVQVFPGCELTVHPDKWHLVIITNNDEDSVKLFNERIKSLSSTFYLSKNFPTIHDINKEFPEINKYIYIPHLDKEPAINDDTLENIRDRIYCGEVSSIKKFIYKIKEDNNNITPLLFSDYRPQSDVTIEDLPIKQTFIQCIDVNFSSIQNALIDKSKVHFQNSGQDKLFNAADNINISTGLTIIVGGRSSGKTYLLNKICKNNSNVKYIKQFELLDKDEKKSEQEFNKTLKERNTNFIEEYLSEYKKVVDEVATISQVEDEKEIEDYLDTLLASAREEETKDVYAKCIMFSEIDYEIKDTGSIEKLIQSLNTLIRNTEFRSIIDQELNHSKLISLKEKFLKALKERILENTINCYINNIISSCKTELQKNTAYTKINDCDFSKAYVNKNKIEKFSKLTKALQAYKVIGTKEFSGFKAEVHKDKFNKIEEIKSRINYQGALTVEFSKYNNPYDYLQALKDNEQIQVQEYYKMFVNIEYVLLNKYGRKVSGGERSEYNLISKLVGAEKFDMLLIDEPESSFDNLFLSQDVNKQLKRLSKLMPVVIATHNSTIGMSIMPDYLIHTRRIIDKDSGKDTYRVYSGLPTEIELIENDNEHKIKTKTVLLDYFEAGKDTYDERKQQYEMLND